MAHFPEEVGEDPELRRNVLKCLWQDEPGIVQGWHNRQTSRDVTAVLGGGGWEAACCFWVLHYCLEWRFSFMCALRKQLLHNALSFSSLLAFQAFGNPNPFPLFLFLSSVPFGGLRVGTWQSLGCLPMQTILWFCDCHEGTPGVYSRFVCTQLPVSLQVACSMPNGPEVLSAVML